MIAIPHRLAFVPLLASLLFVACAGDATSTEEAPAAAAGAPAAEATPAPVSSRSGSSDAAPSGDATGATVTAPGAQFEIPEAWTREQPSSSMRLAQAAIPGEAGPGQLTVFYFGPGGGGGVDANLDRWSSQVEADGPATRESFESGDFRVTWTDVAGTLLPSTMGTGPTERQPNSRLLGAVVEGPQGPWFFKATGPAATLAAERDAFLGMLRSVRGAGS